MKRNLSIVIGIGLVIAILFAAKTSVAEAATGYVRIALCEGTSGADENGDYVGERLQYGDYYYWVVFHGNSTDVDQSYEFRVAKTRTGKGASLWTEGNYDLSFFTNGKYIIHKERTVREDGSYDFKIIRTNAVGNKSKILVSVQEDAPVSSLTTVYGGKVYFVLRDQESKENIIYSVPVSGNADPVRIEGIDSPMNLNAGRCIQCAPNFSVSTKTRIYDCKTGKVNEVPGNRNYLGQKDGKVYFFVYDQETGKSRIYRAYRNWKGGERIRTVSGAIGASLLVGDELIFECYAGDTAVAYIYNLSTGKLKKGNIEQYSEMIAFQLANRIID